MWTNSARVAPKARQSQEAVSLRAWPCGPGLVSRVAGVVLFATLSGCHCAGDKDQPDEKRQGVSAEESAAPSSVDSTGIPVYQEGNSPPPVNLGGHASKRSDKSPSFFDARLGATAWRVSVYREPSSSSKVLGYLRAGATVGARNGIVGRDGCPNGWIRIEPFGFVCQSEGATTDMNQDVLRSIPRGPDPEGTLPYMYGVVRKTGPIYARLPTADEANAAEIGLVGHMQRWVEATDHNSAAFRKEYWLRWKPQGTVPNALDIWRDKSSDPLPSYVPERSFFPGNLSGMVKDKTTLVVGQTKRHNGFAFIDTVAFEGRRYGVTPDLLVLPVDRLRPIEGSTYHGYEIPSEIDFPFALIRVDNAFAYRSLGKTLERAKALPRRSAVKLTGKVQFFNSVLHFETADGLWVSDRHASRLDPAKRMPAWGKNGERWLDINVTKQTLVAYEGTRAVFATVVSTGEAGLGDPDKTRATKRGIFRIHTKHIAATMDSQVVGEEFELRDIPYVQYFEGGYALHAAYWHDDFGKPRSHGCINLAPEDARRLFFWTEPKVPPGWHSVLRPLTGSVLFIHP